MASDSASLDQIPTVPLRDMVVFPQAVQPLFVGTETSINALDSAMAADKKVLLIAKKEADKADPRKKDLFQIGTVATILQLLKLNNDLNLFQSSIFTPLLNSTSLNITAEDLSLEICFK